MKRDPIVLGKNYVLNGDDIEKSLPNSNVLVVGSSGTGKSQSVLFPTIARSQYSNPILSYAKEYDAYRMGKFLRTKGYKVHILNITRPEKSTISFDPLMSIQSYQDIDSLATSIVENAIKETVDDYWSAKAKPMLASLIAAAFMVSKRDNGPCMRDVFKFFDKMVPQERSESVTTDMDDLYKKIEKADSDCYAVREYKAWSSLPYRTAACVRDTLSAALSTVFPEEIRKVMQEKPQFNIEKFIHNKEALFVITCATETSQQYYANLFYRDTERQLLRYAAECPHGKLPREIRYIFDDFACTSPIQGWAYDMSIFRSASISAIMLLQSETQLEMIYKSEAPIIRQNSSLYCYFAGGFDDKSCEIVAKRMGIQYQEVLFAPLGNVYIMQSGRAPVCIERYDTPNSEEFKQYNNVNNRNRKHSKCKEREDENESI